MEDGDQRGRETKGRERRNKEKERETREKAERGRESGRIISGRDSPQQVHCRSNNHHKH